MEQNKNISIEMWKCLEWNSLSADVCQKWQSVYDVRQNEQLLNMIMQQKSWINFLSIFGVIVALWCARPNIIFFRRLKMIYQTWERSTDALRHCFAYFVDDSNNTCN